MSDHATGFREEDLDEHTVDREIRTGEAPWNREHHDARDRQFACHIDHYGDDLRGQFRRSRDDGELGRKGHTALQEHIERGVAWPEDVRPYVAGDHAQAPPEPPIGPPIEPQAVRRSEDGEGPAPASRP